MGIFLSKTARVSQRMRDKSNNIVLLRNAAAFHNGAAGDFKHMRYSFVV